MLSVDCYKFTKFLLMMKKLLAHGLLMQSFFVWLVLFLTNVYERLKCSSQYSSNKNVVLACMNYIGCNPLLWKIGSETRMAL